MPAPPIRQTPVPLAFHGRKLLIDITKPPFLHVQYLNHASRHATPIHHHKQIAGFGQKRTLRPIPKRQARRRALLPRQHQRAKLILHPGTVAKAYHRRAVAGFSRLPATRFPKRPNLVHHRLPPCPNRNFLTTGN